MDQNGTCGKVKDYIKALTCSVLQKFAHKKLILCRDFCSFPFFSWQLNILMTTGLVWFKREKFDASLLLACLPFPYPAIIQHSIVQKCPEFSVLNRWLSLWFRVYLMIWKHVAYTFGKFRERNVNRTEILFSQTGNIIMNELSFFNKFLFHIPHRQMKSDQRSP